MSNPNGFRKVAIIRQTVPNTFLSIMFVTIHIGLFKYNQITELFI